MILVTWKGVALAHYEVEFIDFIYDDNGHLLMYDVWHCDACMFAVLPIKASSTTVLYTSKMSFILPELCQHTACCCVQLTRPTSSAECTG